MNTKKILNAKPLRKDYVTIFPDKYAMKKHFETVLQFDKERQSVILQSIGDGVIATDIEGNIILMNPVSENLTGWKSEDAEGKPISDVFHIINEQTREYCENPVEKVLKTGKVGKLPPNTALISRNGEKEYSISDSCSPIRGIKGNMMGVVLVFRDVTRQKHEEAHKEKITADLIERNKDHEHFASIISHDLRAPVSNIIGLTALINDKNLNKDDKEYLVNALTTCAERLDEVISDLNEIVNVGKQLGKKKEHVFFSKLVSDIQDSIGNILENVSAHFNTDFKEVDEIFTIKSYMYSIFYNLISNSIKYRRTDVPLEITVESHLVDKKIFLIFKDNGLGVDLSKRGNEIFGLYKRFHTDKAEGKGMGLYMVKVQVEKLGGKISVESILDQGTEFTIELIP